MNQDLIITSITNDNARKVIARLICQKQMIPLQKANEIVAKPPFIFLINEDPEQIKKIQVQYSALGITFKVIDSKSVVDSKKEQNLIVPRTTEMAKSSQYVNIQTSIHKDPVVHHLPIDDIPIVVEKKSKIGVSTIVTLGIIVLIPVVLIVISARQKESSYLSGYDGKVDTVKSIEQNKPVNSLKSESKETQKAIMDREKSNDYTDSANAYADDFEMAVKFYKMAISFNRNNYKAWYGLLNAYSGMNKVDKVKKTKEEMEKIFGESVFDITTIVEPFGIIESAELQKDGSYFLEYTTEAQSKKILIGETFQIIRALKPSCNCMSIALYAKQSPGKGLIVHIKTDKPFFTLSDYESAASFTYLE